MARAGPASVNTPSALCRSRAGRGVAVCSALPERSGYAPTSFTAPLKCLAGVGVSMEINCSVSFQAQVRTTQTFLGVGAEG